MTEFKVGQKIRHIHTGYAGKIINISDYNIALEIDKGCYYNFWFTNTSEFENVEEKEESQSNSTEFKVGDKAIVFQEDASLRAQYIKNGEEVEIVGINPRYEKYFFVRNKDNICISFQPHELKPIPKPLKKGQEAWVKMSFDKQDEGGYLFFDYINWCGDRHAVVVKSTHEILIKNDQGEIVPYRDI